MIDPYAYPGTDVLRNKLDIRNAAELDKVERRLVTQRILEGVPRGRFNLDHLRAIHRHLFQDVYDWAGEIRTVNISKGSSHFHDCRRIGFGIDDIHGRIDALGTMRDLARTEVASQLAHLIGDLNFVHPFREGNGRTQLQYARLLAEKAGCQLHLSRLSGPQWVEACVEAMDARYGAMAMCFVEVLRPVDLNGDRATGRQPNRDP